MLNLSVPDQCLPTIPSTLSLELRRVAALVLVVCLYNKLVFARLRFLVSLPMLFGLPSNRRPHLDYKHWVLFLSRVHNTFLHLLLAGPQYERRLNIYYDTRAI